MKRSELIKSLKLIHPVVLYPTMTYDMGFECTIATKDGIVEPLPGMFLFCGGKWPIKKLAPRNAGYVKGRKTYSIRTTEKTKLLFTDILELEETFTGMFSIDIPWEKMTKEELIEWRDEITREGIEITSV